MGIFKYLYAKDKKLNKNLEENLERFGLDVTRKYNEEYKRNSHKPKDILGHMDNLLTVT